MNSGTSNADPMQLAGTSCYCCTNVTWRPSLRCSRVGIKMSLHPIGFLGHHVCFKCFNTLPNIQSPRPPRPKKLDFFTLETHTSSSCLSLQRGENIWSVKHWQHWFCRHSPSTLFTTSSPLWPQQPCHDFQLIPWPGSWHWWLVPTPTHWRAHMEKRESSFWRNWACNNLWSWLWSLLVGMGQTQHILYL